jgi:septal ring factor EnvC (AmiA/AmiB activator)
MTKSAATTLKQLASRLDEQALEIATLRTAIDSQSQRIADRQADLNQLPQAQRREEKLRALLAESPWRDGHHPRQD